MYSVIIVQHQGKGTCRQSDIIDQCRGQRVGLRELRGSQEAQNRAPYLFVDLLQGGDQVVNEADRVIVAFIEGKPTNRDVAATCPLAQQGGLAESGRGRHQRKLAVQASIEPVHQARAPDQFPPHRRDVQFSRQQRHSHSVSILSRFSPAIKYMPASLPRFLRAISSQRQQCRHDRVKLDPGHPVHPSVHSTLWQHETGNAVKSGQPTYFAV